MTPGSRSAKLPRSYWRWDEILSSNAKGFFPYTPATNLLFGLREAVQPRVSADGREILFADDRGKDPARVAVLQRGSGRGGRSGAAPT